MRKNYTHECDIPETRNDLIDMLSEKKPVIVIKNELIENVRKDINSEKESAKKSGGTLKKAGVLAGLWAVFFSSHPIGWLIGGGMAITAGVLKKLKRIMNHYKTYMGKDTSGRDIYVLMYESVSLELDTITYPDFVHSVYTKNTIEKI